MDFVPKLSSVACVLQCGGLWFGGKGWGLTWKVNQIVVKPREVISVYGKCHITLSTDEMKAIEETPNDEEKGSDNEMVSTNKTIEVADSDDDEDDVEEEEPEPEPVKKKKTVKKAEPVNDSDEPSAPKKRVVKKKAIA